MLTLPPKGKQHQTFDLKYYLEKYLKHNRKYKKIPLGLIEIDWRVAVRGKFFHISTYFYKNKINNDK